MTYPYLCQFCGQPVNPNNRGVCLRVVGWVVPGQRGLVLKQPADAAAHRLCVDVADAADQRNRKFDQLIGWRDPK